MAELVDALRSERSESNLVGVQISPAAPCGRGGTGRRAALRRLWVNNPWRFKSSRPHHNMEDDKLFYVGQKAFIEKGGQVLVLIDPDLGLDFPGGKIQEGEADFDVSLKREVKEETDLDIKVGDPFTRWFFKFRKGHRNEGKEVYLVGFRCSYVDGEVKISEEHSEFKWVNKNNYGTLDDKSGYFRALRKYFEGT